MPSTRAFFWSLFWISVSASVSVALALGDEAKSNQQRLLEQKILLVERMLQSSPSSDASGKSGNPEVAELQAQARELVSIARASLEKGEMEAAREGVDEALKMISSASSIRKNQRKSTLVQRDRYKDLSEGIASFRDTLGADLDEEVNALVADARAMAEADDYEGANRLLSRAYEETVSAVARVRDKQTVVYALNFETPADEYAYEVRRFNGNRMLVDLMLEKHKGGAVSELVQKYLDDAEGARGIAEAEAEVGNYQEAVSTMEKAGQHLRRALSLLGVQA